MKKLIVTILSILLFVSIIMFLGNMIIVSNKIEELTNVYVVYALYAIIGILLLVFVIVPMIKICMMPDIGMPSTEGKEGKELYNIGLTLAKNKALFSSDQECSSFLKQVKSNGISMPSKQKELINDLIEARLSDVDKVIRNSAVKVFMLTAISPNSKFDAISVLVINFRMINEMINKAGYRPSYPQLLKLYWIILSTGLLAYATSEVMDDSLFAEIGSEITVKIGSGLFSSIFGKLVGAVADGAVNTLFTMRLGYIAKHYLRNGFDSYADPAKRIQVYKNAFKEALHLGKSIPNMAYSKMGIKVENSDK